MARREGKQAAFEQGVVEALRDGVKVTVVCASEEAAQRVLERVSPHQFAWKVIPTLQPPPGATIQLGDELLAEEVEGRKPLHPRFAAEGLKAQRDIRVDLATGPDWTGRHNEER